VGPVGASRQPVRKDLDGADEIEAQERQVRQVVVRQLFAVEMGMDEAQAPEARRRGAEAVQRRQDDLPVRSDDDEGDLPPAREENPDLPADFRGKLGQVSRQFMGQDAFGRYPAAVKMLDPPDLRGPEAVNIAVQSFDGSISPVVAGFFPVPGDSACGRTAPRRSRPAMTG